MDVKDRDDVIETLKRSEEALRDLRAALQGSGELTVRELADRYAVDEAALVAFAEAAGELVGQRGLSVAAARRGGLLAAAGQAWENELGPLLTSAQVRELLGDVSRQRVDELLRARRLIGLRNQAGRRQFPAFQFREGRPLEPLVEAYWTIADSHVSDWTAAAWCVAPDAALDGCTPARWAREGRDPERLARVARQDAARLAQ